MRVGLCAYPRVTGDRGDRGDSAVLPLFVWHPKHHDYFLYLIWPSPCRPAGGKGFVDSFRPVGGIAPKGHCCGTIVWESKRTKNWSEGWIQKLKDDVRLMKGDLAVIVSEALPKDIENFGQSKGIWITSRHCAVGLAAALRCQLIEISALKCAAIGKNERLEILYRYLSGSEFRQRVEA